MPNNTERQPVIAAIVMLLSLLHPYLLALQIRVRNLITHHTIFQR